MSDEHFINEGTKEYGNPEELLANSYTFMEPLELTVTKLARKVELLEARICSICPNRPENGCCKD